MDVWPRVGLYRHMKTDRFRERMLKGLERHNMSVAELSRRSGVSYDVINKVKRREGASTTAENAAAILAVVEGVDVANAAQEEQGAVSLVPVYAVAASAGSGALVVDGATPILLATLGLMATGERSPHDMSIAIFFVFGSLLAGTALAWALRGLRDL